MNKSILYLVLLFLVISCVTSKKLEYGRFSKEEKKLIMNADSLMPMRVYKITNQSDSLVLRKKSYDVKPDLNDIILDRVINRLYTTVRDSMSLGVGIAAPQVGVLKNIIWVQRFDKENFPFEVYLNPKILKYSKSKQNVREGCLSIPNRSETLSNRSTKITINYNTIKGEDIKEVIEGFTAVIFQHEIDHLNGILYLDHLEKDY